MRGQRRGTLAFENLMEHFGFIRATGEKHYFGGAIEYGKSESDAVSFEFLDPIGDDEAGFFLERGGVGEERCGVTIGAHAKQDEVEARKLVGLEFEEFAKLSFVFRGRGGGIRIFSGDTKDILGGNRNLREQ